MIILISQIEQKLPTKTPGLYFIDPFGYKGLSQKLLRLALSKWGSDCIFLFNYNRVRAAINNPLFANHINALFGEGRADELRSTLNSYTPQKSRRSYSK